MTAWTRLEKIGSGSAGEVWRVQDADGRLAALKLEHRRGTLQAEIAALTRLQHPHIPDVIDADLDADPPYLVMTLAEGEALNVLIATGALWTHPLATRLDALEAIADALHYLHAQGWLHRDVKPSNMRGLNHPFLLDFGLACRVDHLDSPEAGTHAYMPPLGETPSPAADRYAFAVSTYHILFGAHPTRDHHRTTFQAAPDRAADAVAFASGEWRRPTLLPPSAIPGDLRGADLAGLEALFSPAFSADVHQRPPDLRVWLRAIRTCCSPDIITGQARDDSLAPSDNEIPFVPPPALPDFTAQQAAGFDETQPPVSRSWWERLLARLRRS